MANKKLPARYNWTVQQHCDATKEFRTSLNVSTYTPYGQVRTKDQTLIGDLTITMSWDSLLERTIITVSASEELISNCELLKNYEWSLTLVPPSTKKIPFFKGDFIVDRYSTEVI